MMTQFAVMFFVVYATIAMMVIYMTTFGMVKLRDLIFGMAWPYVAFKIYTRR